jgi:hypothetical protein
MIKNLFKRIFLKISSLFMFSNILWFLWRFFNSYFFLPIFPPPVFSIIGENKNRKKNSIVFLGPKEKAFQFCNSMFLRIHEIKKIKDRGLSDLRNFYLQNNQIIAVYMEMLYAKKFLKNGYLILPNLDFCLDLKSSKEEIINQLSKRRRRDIKKIKKKGYTYSLSKHNEKDFDFFYWKMYLPYILKRFGKAAVKMSSEIARKDYERNGGILFIKKENKIIAGLLFTIINNKVYAKILGYKSYNLNYGDLYSGQAALFYLIEWSKNRGIVELNYGNTIPFYKDGIFQYKKEWGMYVFKNIVQPFCAIKFNLKKNEIIPLIKDTPLIFIDKNKIKGFVLIDYKPERKDLQNVLKDYFLPKLDSLVIMAFYQINRNTRNKNYDYLASSLPLHLSQIYFFLKKSFSVELYVY